MITNKRPSNGLVASFLHLLHEQGLSLRGIKDLPMDDPQLFPDFLRQNLLGPSNQSLDQPLSSQDSNSGSGSGISPRITLLVVGHYGSSLWPYFSTSPEYLSGLDHPLDQWSQRIAQKLQELCNKSYQTLAVFPSDGPPYAPFITWSQLTRPLSHSPLGISLDPQAGLWHAFRFALLIRDLSDENFEELQRHHDPYFQIEADPKSPWTCSQCIDTPCLKACPIDAFQKGFYDMQACADYLNSSLKQAEISDSPSSTAACVSQSCLARRACPVGHDFVYNEPHRKFHMMSFIMAHA